MSLPKIIFVLLFSVAFAQKDLHFVPGRNTIVHLFEWKWSDIADECERFLAPKGYGGVQTSPPNENLVIGNRPWWERYQPVSYLLITRSGDEAAFLDMTKRCNAVGVRIYVDTVVNHMSASDGIGTGGSTADYSGKSYPAVPYGSDDFHPKCDLNNFQDPDNVRNCQFNALLDLNQSTDHVREKITEFMNHLIDLGVAGFRMDAAKLILPEDLAIIYGNLKNLNTDFGFAENSRAFIYQEINDLGGEPITSQDYVGIGAIIEFHYGIYLGYALQGGQNLANFETFGPSWDMVDGVDAIAFIDNHDNQRKGDDTILTYKKSKLYKMAIAFMLAHPYGTTRLMSSYYFDEHDQGPPQDENGNLISPSINPDSTCGNGYVCEHRWSEIYNMVGFKNAVEGAEMKNWWSNGAQQIAFSRGDKGFIALTNGGDIDQKLQTGLPAGSYCDVITGSLQGGSCTGKTIVVGADGTANISLRYDEYDGALAIHVNARLISNL